MTQCSREILRAAFYTHVVLFNGCLMPTVHKGVTYLEGRRKCTIILSRQTKYLLCGDRSRAIYGQQHRLIA